MPKKKKSNKPNEKLKEGMACLESWGRWSASGDVAIAIGREGSTMRQERFRHSGGGDGIGLAVDAAIAALGDEYSQLAILLFKRGLSNEAARLRLGWAQVTFDKHLACIKVAAFVACTIYGKTNVDTP